METFYALQITLCALCQNVCVLLQRNNEQELNSNCLLLKGLQTIMSIRIDCSYIVKIAVCALCFWTCPLLIFVNFHVSVVASFHLIPPVSRAPCTCSLKQQTISLFFPQRLPSDYSVLLYSISHYQIFKYNYNNYYFIICECLSREN